MTKCHPEPEIASCRPPGDPAAWTRRGRAEFVQNNAESVRADQHATAVKDTGVEQRSDRDQRGVVRAVESDLAQLPAVLCNRFLVLDLLSRPFKLGGRG